MFVELQRIDRVKASLVTATPGQVLALEAVIRDIVACQFADFALVRRNNAVVEARLCPHCGVENAMLHGKERNGRQRFRCSLGCHRTFNTLTGTPMARARKPEKWGQYLGCMTDFMSIREIVLTGIELNHRTVWRWRHRFLKATANDNAVVLSGIIEADETFFVRSFKGHRGWKRGLPPENRAARPSAWGAFKRGVSGGQVPVLTALDTNGGVFERVLGNMGEIDAALAGRIAPGSVLCSDGAQAYLRSAKVAGAEHRRVFVAIITPASVKAAPLPTSTQNH